MLRKSLLCSASLLLAAACSAPPAAPPARASDIALARDSSIVQAKVPPHATLAALLRANDLAESVVAAIVQSTRAVFDPRRLMPDHEYQIARSLSGRLRDFQYQIDSDRILRVAYHPGRPDDSAFAARIIELPRTQVMAVAAGVIDRTTPSLFEAVDAAGETPDLAMAMAAIYGGEIDFSSDLQPGDRFNVLFDKDVRDGKVVGEGPIAAAEFDNAGRRLVAIRFTPDGGEPGYYDEHGRSLKRFFLRSPLKFEPNPFITSGFSRDRYHPILHIYRAHLGVDYRAPIGSPVIAVAGGVVLSAGWDGEAGRLVHLRHADGYETYYMHLSSIAPGIRRGVHVQQGELIGRVGESGLATGPHLDFRIRSHGMFVNPVLVRRSLPPGEPIPAADLEAFRALRDRDLARLHGHLQRPPTLVAADEATVEAGPQ